ncbi:MAG: outer membrane lipoprotein carrier protein LolA [Phycisphaerae bacterium]
MHRMTQAITCGLIVALCPNLAFGETLEQIEAKLAAAQDKLNSMTAATTTVQDMEMGGGSMKSHTQGTYEWLRQGKNILFRLDITGTHEQSFGGQATKSTSTTTMISDGQFVYTLADQNGQKMATKAAATKNANTDVRAMFKSMHESYNLKPLPDETVDGRICYVIELVPKETQNNPMSRQKYYMCKELGMSIKSVAYDASGKEMMSTLVTEIKTGAKISPDRFKFQPPAGVEVMDLTGQ